MSDNMNLDKGGVKMDGDKPRFDLIPPEPLFAMADILTSGAKKYEDRNWEKGMRWGRVFAAMMRHWLAWWAGKGPTCVNFAFGVLDDETGRSHAWHGMTCAAFLVTYEERGIGEDDRPTAVKGGETEEPKRLSVLISEGLREGDTLECVKSERWFTPGRLYRVEKRSKQGKLGLRNNNGRFVTSSISKFVKRQIEGTTTKVHWDYGVEALKDHTEPAVGTFQDLWEAGSIRRGSVVKCVEPYRGVSPINFELGGLYTVFGNVNETPHLRSPGSGLPIVQTSSKFEVVIY